MDPTDTTTSSPSVTAGNGVEGMLQGLWEKVRQAGELITELRSQKSMLGVRVEELQRDIEHLKKKGAEQEEVVKSLSQQLSTAESVEGKMFSNGEREKIAERVKELLVRIEGYL